MGLGRADRLSMASGINLQDLPLTPQDFFVLSRVEGTEIPVGDVLATSGLDDATTLEILEKLVQLGALAVATGAGASTKKPPRPRRVTTSSDLRDQAAARRRRLLARQLAGGGGSGEGSSGDGSRAAAPPEARSREPEKAGSGSPAFQVGGTLEPASPDDERLDPDLDIAIDDQRRLLAIRDRMAELNPFELLGLEPTNDEKLIRRAYFAASRQLHPDRYYRKQLGIFKPLLDHLFAHAKKAYEVLLDREKREPFVARVQAIREHEARVAEAERARAEAERLARQEAERKRREEEEAAEREARRKRDEARKRRHKDRISGTMRAKAQDHVDMAEAALAEGNYASAANHFRMAKQLDPSNAELDARWQETLGVARRQRADAAFARAEKLVDLGHVADASPFFLEAAAAHPSPKYLATAAEMLKDTDAAKSRELALAALDALLKADGEGVKMSPRDRAHFHVQVARAFRAAGQKKSALEQVEIAATHAPDSPEVKDLLKRLK